MKLILGDCLDKLKELKDNSVDSIVTDPPYGLSFMGKKWDYDVPSQEIWGECIRVLKPGGHLLSFAGSRTYHRMAVRIEDAGFEIRDQIMWIYGSGFPKSMNISKQIDKQAGLVGKIIGQKRVTGTMNNKGGASVIRDGHRDFSDEVLDVRELVSNEAKQWTGWGTALKPAHEPIVMARKPLSEKTVVDNVLKYGTGGINIDESRVGNEERLNKGMSSLGVMHDDSWKPRDVENTTNGRFPANVIHDGSDEVTKLFPNSKSTGGKGPKSMGTLGKNVFGKYKNDRLAANAGGLGDEGSAARFFYCPKTSKKDRNEGLEHLEDKFYAAGNQAKAELKRGNTDFNSNTGKGRDERHNHNQVGMSKNNHPTVKPTDLMLYLIRLVTPKNGTTLDPFMGSGSTGKAAIRGGFDFIGIEREKEYMEISEARIQYEIDNPYNEITKTREEALPEVKTNLNKFFE